MPKNLQRRIRQKREELKLADIVRTILVLCEEPRASAATGQDSTVPIEAVYGAFHELWKRHKAEFTGLHFAPDQPYSKKLEQIFFNFGVWGRLQVVNPKFDYFIIRKKDKQLLSDLYKRRYGKTATHKVVEHAKEFSEYLNKRINEEHLYAKEKRGAGVTKSED